MTNICFYFQVHQPYRLRNYSVFDIGHNHHYWDDKKNAEVMQKVARKCYIPANNTILHMIKKHGGKFKASYSITGTAMEQFQKYAPEVLESFKELAKTGCVEFLGETYFHSLSFVFNKDEFKHQVAKHNQLMADTFGVKPVVFRNTELIYNNELAHHVEQMGYKAIIAEGVDHILGWRSPNFVYQPKTTHNMKLLLKNYKLSDDVAFRFSNKNWESWPLTTPKFVDWVAPVLGDTINLFMDYETFGEHQWEDTGIFQFLEHLPQEMFNRNLGFQWPSELTNVQAKDVIDIHNLISWADIERDLSAWLGNRMQHQAADALYKIRGDVMASGDEALIADWQRLTTSDHLYYMCTKWFADGDVHKYFNPYDTPYECFINFMNVLNDIAIRLKTHAPQEQRAVVTIR